MYIKKSILLFSVITLIIAACSKSGGGSTGGGAGGGGGVTLNCTPVQNLLQLMYYLLFRVFVQIPIVIIPAVPTGRVNYQPILKFLMHVH
jgi:hypothetical protein